MPDKPPKYTIGKDYDPDGDISANAEPFWEFVTYAKRVKNRAIADMGFTLDDFQRYIEGLPKERRSKSEIAPSLTQSTMPSNKRTGTPHSPWR